jgi:hypothetical protein
MTEAHLHLNLYIFVIFDLFGPHETIKSIIKAMTFNSFIVNSIVHYIMLDVISYYSKRFHNIQPIKNIFILSDILI